jgi:hypothetical protein
MKYRFRKTVDVDIEADSEVTARTEFLLEHPDSEKYELIGEAEIPVIDEEMQKKAYPYLSTLTSHLVMSIQYRGENFAALCQVKNLDADRVSVTPVALLLNEEQKKHLTDVKGRTPRAQRQVKFE